MHKHPLFVAGIAFVVTGMLFVSYGQRRRIETTAERVQPPPQAPGDPPPGDFTIKTNVKLVLLDVSVKDSAGGFVSDLTKDNFVVTEDGKPQTITQFASQDAPVSIGIVVDESGSMRSKRPEVITAALALIGASNPEDETFVINFNEKVFRGLPDRVLFSDNTNMLRNALWSTQPEGRTALYDALFASLRQLDWGRRDKKTLVLISDGGDNISTHNFKDVMNQVEKSLATIYTVGVFDEDDPDRNPGVLRDLARVSGGVAYFPQKLEEVVPICKGIAKDIRNRYTIGYVPAGGSGKSQLRHIKLTVSAPDHGKLIARTRTSYLYSEEGVGESR
ncbi:MAG TPA: VWA domain-containing protein [Bryobacteraceae bacterium]|nr:VWA domain-containing protein [Bryobacteraceae bacterium]